MSRYQNEVFYVNHNFSIMHFNLSDGYDHFVCFPFQDHVKEKLKLVQKFLHVDAQDQLTSLEESMKNSEITMVRCSLQHDSNVILPILICC